MYEALASILIAILSPFVAYVSSRKTEASDAPPVDRKRWFNRVRSFESSIRK